MSQVSLQPRQYHLRIYSDDQNRCGEGGHKARECPTDPEGPMKCFNCGQEGQVTISTVHYSLLTQTSTATQRLTAPIPKSSPGRVAVVKRKDTLLQNVPTSLQSSATTAKKRVESHGLYDSVQSDVNARPLSI